MTHRINREELDSAVARLQRNIMKHNKTLELSVREFNGYIHLFNRDGSKPYSQGNSKSELYWQVQLVNKILEDL